jgi:hypothetical protein
VLIEEMNAFLYKEIEGSRFMATIKTVGQQVELNEEYNQILWKILKSSRRRFVRRN